MKKYDIFFVLVLVTLLFSGCKYDFVLPEEVPAINPNVPISFATKIVPIFTTGTCISCHKAGGQAPDLTSTAVYSQIVPSLVNLSTPETSKIYTYPGSSAHSWKAYTASEASLVLEWIKQGAKNN